MSHIPGKISHSDLIEIINEITKAQWGKLYLSPNISIPFSCYKQVKGKGFNFKFSYNTFSQKKIKLNLGLSLTNVRFVTKQYDLVLKDFFIGSRSLSSIIANVSQIHTNGYSKRKKYYYRLVIPLKKELSFHYQIEQSHYNTDLGYRSRAGLQAKIDDDLLYGCIFHSKQKEYYLSIESHKAQGWESFSSRAHALKNALGYMSGYLPGDNGFYFAYSDRNMELSNHFFFTGFRNSIINSYVPVYANPYGYIRNRSLADKYYRKKMLRPINIEEFSRLCQKIRELRDFESCLVLIMESSVASLLFMPGGLAIALETLSDLIIGKTKVKLSPIKSKSLSKKIREECAVIIKKYGSEIEGNDLKTLLTRIEQLNQTTNKARLRTPFDILNIGLLPEDLKILETRNDFLHGRFPDITKEGIGRNLDRINRDLYYASIRFYTLLSLLILKWIGYDNYVLNHPKIQSKYCRIKLDEDFYRKV